MKILGLSCFYHEAAACLLVDGKIIAASAQERFSRIKHDSFFPYQAISFCLEIGNIKGSSLDFVVFYEKPFLKFERNLLCSLKYFPHSSSFFVDSMKNFLTEKLWLKATIASKLKIDPAKILFVPHHLSHAAAAYYPSPFNQAAYLTLDGIGEWTTASFGQARGLKIFPQSEMRFPHSLGLLYATMTAFLGFQVNDGEYKVMGMAGFGKPKYCSKVKKLYRQAKDGSLKLNLSYFAFHRSSRQMYSTKFLQEFSGLNKFDLAASLQKCTEEIIFNLLEKISRQTHKQNLVFGGGVALNSVVNGKILTKSPFKNVFIFPAAGDDGGAVGTTLYLYHHVLGYQNRQPLKDIFWGIAYPKNEVRNFLTKKKVKFQKLSPNELADSIATYLTNGKVVGLFEGRAEFGPRALGHRSILADPRDPKMKDRVNSKIKFREEFRPFAPAVLAEVAPQYFQKINYQLSPFMLGTFSVKPQMAKKIPAVVHVDDTARIQTVGKNHPGNLRKILEAFRKKTGIGALLNTSFNLRGQPIVNSPADAYQTFISSGLDILVIENFLIEK